MSPAPAIALVVFDLDGVLVDSSGCHARGYADLWERLAVTGPPYERVAGRATVDVVEEFTRHLAPSPDRLGEWVRYKQERARHHLEASTVAFPDTVGAVQRLARRFPLALATGASRQTALQLLDRMELRPFFPVVIAAEDAARGKPDPEPFRLAIEASGGRPERSLVIEDSRAGLSAALASGAWAVTVRSGLRDPHQRFLGAFADLQTLGAGLGWWAA